MGGGHNCKLARSGAAQRLKLTVRQLASKMATGGCVARSPVLHRAGQKVAYSVSGYPCVLLQTAEAAVASEAVVRNSAADGGYSLLKKPVHHTTQPRGARHE